MIDTHADDQVNHDAPIPTRYWPKEYLMLIGQLEGNHMYKTQPQSGEMSHNRKWGDDSFQNLIRQETIYLSIIPN